MSFQFDGDRNFAEDLIFGETYRGIDHVQAMRVASDLSKKYDFISRDRLLLGWGQLPLDELSQKISKKELDALYRRVRSNAKNLKDSLAPFHVASRVDGVDGLVSVLDDLMGIGTPDKREFHAMNECMFLGGVALAYDRMYPHKEFKRNVLLINAALDVQRSFNLGQQHSSSVAKDDPSSLNKYLQRGRQLLRVTTQERHRMTE